ncbi:S8 family peptidase [Clostridium sp. TF11-13AC]|uniref:S8 family peptidase n=1 Tax=Clostridium sp. TF11-13AC TaxID=2293053 RepID=UPI001FAAC2DA|nr:S8 family peptidase [Clostridium sp. TF11-13AC]
MKKKLFRGLAAALCAAMMAGSAALPAYAAGPSRESVPYADSYASYQWAFLNTGELRLVPSHTAVVDAAIGAITGSPALSADGTVRSLEGIDMNIVPAWKKYDAKSGKRQVIVALIDTGVDITHPELSGSIWTNTGEIPGDGIDNDGNGYIDDVYGWNFYDNNAQVFTGADDNHGTHSAGTIAAARNGVGTVGICDPAYVKIMVIKTLGTSSGVGTVSNVVKAIRYAQANGASICNLSFGTMKYSEELYQAIKDSGMLFIVAAGNGDASGNGYSIDEQPMYPASFELDNIISVANLRFDGQLDRASNYGVRSVDLAAPGNYILSTITGNDYAYMSGTSMAAPMVTGTAAMLYSCDASLSLMDVRNRILQSARPIESLSGKVATGGMLDAGAAMP